MVYRLVCLLALFLSLCSGLRHAATRDEKGDISKLQGSFMLLCVQVDTEICLKKSDMCAILEGQLFVSRYGPDVAVRTVCFGQKRTQIQFFLLLTKARHTWTTGVISLFFAVSSY